MKYIKIIINIINSIAVSLLTALIDLYRMTLSALLGSRCIYYPSCSVYAKDALRLMGPLRGSTAALLRILRCNGLFLGGPDELTEQLTYLEMLSKYREHWYASALKKEKEKINKI